jgi:hypothetical protein
MGVCAVAATSKASKKPLTASEMREKARRRLEASENEQDTNARMVLLDEALRLAMAAEQLDRAGTRKTLVPSTRKKSAA